MRRADRQITDQAHIDRILTQARYATIALTDGDQPYLVTLSCGYDADNRRLCFHVARAGRKLDLIAANPKACASVIADGGYRHGECAHPFESVVMTGTMRILEDAAEVRSAMRLLITRLEAGDNAQAIFERNKLDSDAALKQFRLLVFEIDDVSAKAGK